MAPAENYGLGEPAMLEKIDKLFACGVGDLVDLPQIVVVGDQSSGKSSVLEGLIKKPLPRDSGLCTRFATQIVFRRAFKESIHVSIVPARDASAEHSSRLKAWGKAVASLSSQEFVDIMKEVQKEMGLSGDSNGTERKATFSDDVFKLEIAGPDQEHLTVIDVPGIFRGITQGVTTTSDIRMVKNMVSGYMSNPRSVMLAVIPANVDPATQEILEMATSVDPSGDRTLGVLTKPDLVDKGAEPPVVDMLEGRSRGMKLGWHLIRNPGQSELSRSDLDRGVLEVEFLRLQAPWNGISRDKVGVDALRGRLKEVLSSLVKREFPKVKAEIKSRQVKYKQQLADLGPERSGSAEQMAFLTQLADRFQRLVNSALDAKYGSNDYFDDLTLRLAPAIRTRMDTFSVDMDKYGETYPFLKEDGTAPTPSFLHVKTFDIRKENDSEAIEDILHPQKSLPSPIEGVINKWLLSIFKGNRGFELGTFNASIIATTMRKQSEKWADISLGYVSDVIAMVHSFISAALATVCADSEVRESLIAALTDELLVRYQKAIESTKFLLRVEANPAPTTLNHYFNDNLQKSRSNRVMAQIKKHKTTILDGNTGKNVNVIKADAAVSARDMSNDEHVVQDIHDILKSYYEVTRKTFVDCVTKQSINHFLLYCEESPLALFSPVFVSQLSTVELEEIAGEAPGLRRLRAQLTKEVASLSDAMKILARA